jgi:Pyruvate/2-oxoacid:ferredoxin oxidoreductase delta subunit
MSFIKPSTRAYWEQANKIPHYSLTEKIHGYAYLRWPFLYIATATGSNRLGRAIDKTTSIVNKIFPPRKPRENAITWADTYHGKVVPLKAATELVSIKEDICINDLEKIIPYQLARSIVLDHPDHIVALDCPCRAARENPCLPLDVCLIVGEPFASFTLEHNPKHSRAITSSEAVEILKVEDERGHVHHAFFKEAVLERFYAICNCCSCCCGAIRAHLHGNPMLASSGYTAKVDENLCIGCGDCNDYCQFGALSMIDGMNHVDFSNCMGCGVCVSHCSQDAIQLVLTPEKGIPLEMREIVGG